MTFSYLNPKCEARPNKWGGCSVYALENISKDELVSLWGGKVIRRDDLDPSMPRFTERVLQAPQVLVRRLTPIIATSRTAIVRECYISVVKQ